ncbi:toxin biosynthesis protein [Talaromyces pinophilus]|uniref:Toxin biosynthesis protein n=1 Tax=Talaromyces pinophilus TaxID=128442 RepID=A0A698XKQ5_TALPI|nr:toxin biosynthesis protein [Talaromyces pinophilus]
MGSVFNTVEHVLPGQHIREYVHSINGPQETVIQLAIKQYVPKDRLDPVPKNAITIIGTHGTGFPKELYEPLWEDLYTKLKRNSIPLRGIWVADVSNQGASGILNEDIQGDTTNWFDHSRDLLHMINHFRKEMPRPIIGVGHSMGCAQLIHLSLLHPRLLSTLVLYEPVILDRVPPGPNPAKFAAVKRDVWPSRQEAEEALRKALRKWDPRVVDRYLRFGLRSVPTRLYNPNTDHSVPVTAVTLTTSKHQEAWSYTIPNLEPESAGLDRLLLSDWDFDWERNAIFSRPECYITSQNLPHLRPGVLWVFSGKSYLSPPEAQDVKLNATGTGVGGSGGVKEGMVAKVVLEKGSHALVLEDVDWSATVASDWIQKWFSKWMEEEEFWKNYRSKRSDAEMLRLSEEAHKVSQLKFASERPKAKL